MRRGFVLAAFVVFTLAACNRNIEPYVEGEEPRQPDLARIFPDGGEAPGPSLGGPQVGATPRSARPGLPPAPPRAAQDSSGEAIRGSIGIAPDLAAGAPQAATLFVIARLAGATRGPPLAVRRIANARFPLDFEIGPQHAMIQGVPFAGAIQLTARLDGDGDAMTRRPGDLSGSAASPVEPGSSGVQIVLDQRI